MRILLKNAEAITINENGDVLKDCCIGINNEKIEYIGQYKEGMDESYTKIIDCKGKVVMPGFVNAHNHAAMTMFRNYADDMKLMDWLFNKIFPLEDKLTDEAAYWASLLAISEMLRGGTTTFSDMYFFMDSTAKAVGESGVRAVLARGLHGDSGDDMDYRFRENIQLFEQYHNAYDGRIKTMFGPHAVYTCTVPYMQKVWRKSKELGMGVQIHVSETKEEVRECYEKHGVSPVKLLYDAGLLDATTVAAHCVNINDEDMHILSEAKVNVVHNPGSNMKLASGIAPIADMLNKNINICLGTDGASSNNNLDMLEEARMAAYLQKVHKDDPTVLPVDTVLKMLTANGAKALGFNDVGYLQEGMKADLIIISTEKPCYYPKYNIKSALVYSGNSSDVETVIIDGKVVMEKGIILTFDEEKVMFEAQRWAEKLTEN